MPEPEIELDRTYTVPLSRAWIAPRYKRTSRAVNVLREYAEKHMKSSEIKIDSDLNERMWNRGITKPPRRIKVRMTKDEDGLVTISLPPKVAPEEASDEEEHDEGLDGSNERVSKEESTTENEEEGQQKKSKTTSSGKQAPNGKKSRKKSD